MRKLFFILLLFPLFANSLTPIFCCGFECGTISSAHIALFGTTSFSTTTVRSGVRSFRSNPNASANACAYHFHTNSTTKVVRVYVRFASLPNANCPLVTLSTGPLSPIVAFRQSDSKIYPATYNTTGDVYTFGSTGATITTGIWYRIDMYINVSANPWTIDVQIDGVALTQYTVATANTSSSEIYIGHRGNNNVTADMFFDDLVVSNTAGDYPIGGGYVNHFVPTSDGTHNVAGSNDFERSATGVDITNATTTAYQLIDDIPMEGTGSPTDYINLVAPPNATDHVECKYGPAPGISAPTAGPRAVEVIVCYGKGTGQGSNNIRLAINDNGTTNDVFNGNVSGTSPAVIYNTKQYATPPTGGTWNANSSGNGAFKNIRVRCYTSDAAPDPWFISTMIEAEFQEQVTLPHRIKIISKNQSKEKDIYTNASQVGR